MQFLYKKIQTKSNSNRISLFHIYCRNGKKPRELQETEIHLIQTNVRDTKAI